MSNGGRLLAIGLAGATVALVAIGTLWPSKTALASGGGVEFSTSAGTPEAAVRSLGEQIHANAYGRAYESLANKGEFSEQQFRRDLTSGWPDLRTYATLSDFQVQPLHATDTETEVRLKMQWSTVVGPSPSERDLHLVKNGGKWQIQWPITKEPVVPPQVIPVNYLR